MAYWPVENRGVRCWAIGRAQVLSACSAYLELLRYGGRSRSSPYATNSSRNSRVSVCIVGSAQIARTERSGDVLVLRDGHREPGNGVVEPLPQAGAELGGEVCRPPQDLGDRAVVGQRSGTEQQGQVAGGIRSEQAEVDLDEGLSRSIAAHPGVRPGAVEAHLRSGA